MRRASSTPARPRASTATSARPTTARPRPASPPSPSSPRARLRRYGVTVNAISPSAQTRMTEGLRELTAEQRSARDPKWVSPAVVYLASEEAQDITGRVIQAGFGRIAVCEGWRRGAGSRPSRRSRYRRIASARDDPERCARTAAWTAWSWIERFWLRDYPQRFVCDAFSHAPRKRYFLDETLADRILDAEEHQQREAEVQELRRQRHAQERRQGCSVSKVWRDRHQAVMIRWHLLPAARPPR